MKLISPKNFHIIISLMAIVALMLSIVLLGNDNPVEEIAEEIIKEEVGLEFDITPNSLEKQKEDSNFLLKSKTYHR